MDSTITFTSTLSSNLMDWLNKVAKERKVTKRAILEEAIRRLQSNLKRKKMIDTFERATLDPEMHEMAEEGLDDYSEQLKNLGI